MYLFNNIGIYFTRKPHWYNQIICKHIHKTNQGYVYEVIATIAAIIFSVLRNFFDICTIVHLTTIAIFEFATFFEYQEIHVADDRWISIKIQSNQIYRF